MTGNPYHPKPLPSGVPVPRCFCGSPCKVEISEDEKIYRQMYWMCSNFAWEPTALMLCRLPCKIETHPIPLPKIRLKYTESMQKKPGGVRGYLALEDLQIKYKSLRSNMSIRVVGRSGERINLRGRRKKRKKTRVGRGASVL
jgi:hypothetical protein